MKVFEVPSADNKVVTDTSGKLVTEALVDGLSSWQPVFNAFEIHIYVGKDEALRLKLYGKLRAVEGANWKDAVEKVVADGSSDLDSDSLKILITLDGVNMNSLFVQEVVSAASKPHTEVYVTNRDAACD